MTVESVSRLSRSAVTLSLALSVSVLCRAQSTTPPATPGDKPQVSANPRAGNDDPRVGLKGGLYDAGEAAFGMERLTSLPKPAGFAPGDDVTATTAQASTPAPPPATPGAAGETAPAPPRPSQYGSTNSDLAFSGNHLFVGNYNGIAFYDVDNPKQIKLRASLVCPGGQGDVSVYGHLLFMSAEAANGRIDCGTQGIPLPAGYVPPPPPPAEPTPAPAAGAAPAAGTTPPRVRRPARRPAPTVFAAFASSTFPIFRTPSKSPPCKAAAARILIRS